MNSPTESVNPDDADRRQGGALGSEARSTSSDAVANETEESAYGSTSATRDPTQLAELGRRVTELELEVTRLRSVRPDSAPEEVVNSRLQPFTPPYIARAVVAVEGHLSDMERFAVTGNENAAQQSRIAAAMRSCSALRKLCDDDDFLQILMSMGNLVSEQERQFRPAADAGSSANINTESNARFPAIIDDLILSPEFKQTGASFHDLEVQLLQIAGLPEILANAHVGAAIDAYRQNPIKAMDQLRNPMAFLASLRSLREASCLSADFLAQGVRHEQARQRYKKLLTFGLSGTLIVAANSIGTAILGPVGVAASGAIGSAAVGVAVQLLS
jgi:hypothetical protein